MSRKPDTPCSGCGKLIYRGRGSLPPGLAVCRPCRARRDHLRLAVCRKCGDTFNAPQRPQGGRRRTTCSAACAQALRNATPRTCTCLDCGGLARGPGRGRCSSCKSAINRQKNARRRGAMSSDAPLTIWMLGDRDGWRCHLCHRRVRSGLRVPHPLAPTFDHLIPVSKGGNDSRVNLRLAHFRCNSRRGARGVVQLLLVG